MAFEGFFQAPGTLRKYRSGPLGKIMEGFCDWLLVCSFSQLTIYKHMACVFRFNEYLSLQSDAVLERVALAKVKEFLEMYPSWCRPRGPLDRHVRNVRYSISRFVKYLCSANLLESCIEPEIYRPLLDEYLKWMRQHQHSAIGTLAVRELSLIQFLRWLGVQATSQGISGLNAQIVEDFFLTYAKKAGRSARRSMQSALRTFLRFCLHRGYIRASLDFSVPTLRTYKLATVPRGLSDENAQNLLQSINRSTACGRRDFAMCQLLYTYGVRGGQVRMLRLGDINWAENQILFRALKKGKEILVPLTVPVGESLLDYLQNARPHCDYPEVFLTTRAPYHPIIETSTLSNTISYHLGAAGIDAPSKGAHAFRHGFASKMLEKGHSLKAIADMLGHRHLSTTFIYTKVDFNTLSAVGLEWPQEVE